MNILLSGHVCIDENISEKAEYTSWGSALMYMADYFNSRTEDNVSLLAPHGEDFLKYAKKVHFINKPYGNQTLTYKNVSVAGQRTQVAEETEFANPLDITEDIKEAVKDADIIVLAPLLANYLPNYVSQLLSYKRDSCLTVLLPQGYFRRIDSFGHVSYEGFDEAADILPFFDIAILSDSDIKYNLETVKVWASQSPLTKIIVTEGEKGASWIKENNQILVSTTPIPEDEIVDSVGCGDTFSAALLQDYFLNRDIESALRSGNIAAGNKLRQASPMT